MRMDEYQQWLAAQFVDDEEELMPAAEPMAVVHEVVEQNTQGALSSVSEHVGSGVQTLDGAEATSAEASTSAPVQVTVSVEQSHVLEPRATPPPPSVYASHSPRIWDEEAEVPAIENYFPFLKRTPVAEAVTESESVAQPAAEVEEEAPTDQAKLDVHASIEETTPRNETPTLDLDEPALPVEIKSLHQPEAASAVGANGLARPSVSTDIASSAFRGRRARNVNVTRSVEPIEFDSLWSLVPKHIQVLVAMGSDDEVVQNSYKRSFKESRIELIEKLLDPTLSLEDTARLLNVCPTTVRRYTNKGMLTHQRTSGDQRRFKLSDVLTFLEAQPKPESRTRRRSVQP